MKLKRNEAEEVDIDMSPMIDMVFLLLIFFIVASQIVKIDKEPIELPSALYAKVPEDETGRYLITVNREGEMFVGPAADRVTIDELKEEIAAELEQNEDLRILIRADRKTRAKENEKIMEACAEVGANDMIFAAFEQ
ncbi:MAG TPA: biopolymer transporter ExbD [Tichowtungia sp.]|nr:biopolymer transporter ExbD [Tichowtungia sp.]